MLVVALFAAVRTKLQVLKDAAIHTATAANVIHIALGAILCSKKADRFLTCARQSSFEGWTDIAIAIEVPPNCCMWHERFCVASK